MIHIIPVLSDNYCYAIETAERRCVLVDPGDAAPVVDCLRHLALDPVAILSTHHHDDHVGGNLALKERYRLDIYGPAAERDRIPGLDHALVDGDVVTIAGLDVHVRATPGHTLGHIVLECPSRDAIFTGDTLFSLGCGRLFEGTPAQMQASLAMIAGLPDRLRIYGGHEYSAVNARFALSVDPGNQRLKDRAAEITRLRATGEPTYPVLLADEKAANPFLRAGGVEEFAALRRRRDVF